MRFRIQPCSTCLTNGAANCQLVHQYNLTAADICAPSMNEIDHASSRPTIESVNRQSRCIHSQRLGHPLGDTMAIKRLMQAFTCQVRWPSVAGPIRQLIFAFWSAQSDTFNTRQQRQLNSLCYERCSFSTIWLLEQRAGALSKSPSGYLVLMHCVDRQNSTHRSTEALL